MNKNNLWYLLILLLLSACAQKSNFDVDRYQIDDVRDSDKDGVINQRDLCNDTPETVAVDNAGCAYWDIVEEKSWVPIEFEYDSEILRAKELLALNTAVDKLNANRAIKVVLIGDTSGEGSLQYNENLAIKRNKTIKDYLLSWGIEGERIETQIFAEATPFTKYLKVRKRRTILVFIEEKKIFTNEWNIFSTEVK